MLSEFQEALNADKSLNFKHVPHYIRWVRECYNFFRTPPTERLPLDQTRLFLTHLEKSRENWQVKQAEQALRRFDFFLTEKSSPSPSKADNAGWEDVLAKTRDVLRLKQMALNTEKTYLSWLRRFQHYLGAKPPEDLSFEDMRRYLSHLAVEGKVASSTQNQALNAILFLYRHILDIDTGEEIDAVRAQKRRRLPVVLSNGSITRLLHTLETFFGDVAVQHGIEGTVVEGTT